MKLLKPALIGLASLALSANSMAAPFAYGDGGSALQNILDDITVTNPNFTSDPNDPNDVNGNIPSSVDVVNDTLGNNSWWEITGSGISGLTRIKALNTQNSNAAFGIYDVSDPNKKVELFGNSLFTNSINSSSMMDSAAINIMDDGSVIVNIFSDSGIDFSHNRFGYYLDTGTDIFYSDKTLNPNEMDHMVAFQGNNLDYIKIGNHSRGEWTDSEYFLAWDISGDKDYEDFVVMVESVKNVPEPSVLILCAIGLLGYGLSQRKTVEE